MTPLAIRATPAILTSDMAISNVQAGKVIRRSKLNELISAVGSLEVSWVNFNGGTGVVRNSFGNIASVARTGAGQYTVSFSTPRASINYAVRACCSATAGNDTGFVDLIDQTRSTVRIQCRNDDGGIGDPSIVCLRVLGPDPNNRSTALSAIIVSDKTVQETVTAVDTGSAQYTLFSDGTHGFATTLSGSGSYGNWVEDVTEADSFEVRATFQAGQVPAGSAFGVWLDLASTRFWELTNATYIETWCTFRIDVRDKASLQVRGSAVITLAVQLPFDTGGGGD